MKIGINYNDKDYKLAFTRATAKAMSKSAERLNESDDIVEGTELILKASLKAEHPDLPAEEEKEVVQYILENCQLVDIEDEEKGTVKGLISLLNEMLSNCLPKGFTGKTEKGFVVME